MPRISLSNRFGGLQIGSTSTSQPLDQIYPNGRRDRDFSQDEALVSLKLPSFNTSSSGSTLPSSAGKVSARESVAPPSTSAAPSEGMSAAAQALKQRLSADQADFTLHIPSLPPDCLRIVRWQGVEQLSQFFAFELTLVSDVFDIDLEALMGTHAWIRLRGLSGDRHIAGMIERCEQLAVGRRFSHYRLTLAPTLSPLRYNRTCRVFKQLSSPEIVKSVLKSNHITPEQQRWLLRATYPKRDFCVQYQESDHDFCCRLLEEEGIFFYFDHVKHPDRDEWYDVWVLGDGDHALEPVPLTPTLPFRDEARSTSLEEEHIYRLHTLSSITPARVSLRDYRFKQPDLDLETSHQGDGYQQLEVYYHPGEYVEPHLGKRLAQVRQEALAVQKLRVEGESNARGLRVGHHMTLELHPRTDQNRAYLLLRLEHEASQPQSMLEETGADQVQSTAYSVRWQGIPLEVPFRPPRVTPRPSIPGVQSAKVIGPKSEEIHCDAYGRVLVKFHWDRGAAHHEETSCWIRSSQAWAGQGYGALFIPRVGQEVLVQFIEGDPDRPVIVGRVHNERERVPYALPEHKTRSTLKTHSTPNSNGFNELRFEDRSESEEIYLHAQKDYNAEVLHNEARDIGNDASLHVGHDRTHTVDNDESLHIGHDQSIVIDANQVNLVKESRQTTIQKNDTRTVVEGNDVSMISAGSQLEVVHGDRTHVIQTGSDLTAVEQGDSILSVNGTRWVNVFTGDHRTNVAEGSCLEQIQKDKQLSILEGSYRLTVAEGELTQSAQQNIVMSSAADVQITADKNSSFTAGDQSVFEAQQIFINGAKSITLKVGPTELTLSAQGITLKGPNITAEAVAILDLKGTLVKLN